MKTTQLFSFTNLPAAKAWNRPAIPLLISFIFGILMGNDRPGIHFVFSVSAILAACLIVLHILRKKPSVLPPFFLFICLGYLAIQPWKTINLPASHVIHHVNETKKIITGTVLTTPVFKHHRVQFTLETETIGYAKKESAVTGKLRVTVSGEIPTIRTGDRIALKGRIRPIRNFNNPGGFDYQRFMAFSGIHARVYSRGEHIQILEHRQAFKPLQAIESLREKIAIHLDQSIDGEPRQILKALLLGDRTQITDDLRESFTRSGVAHILAISGLHIGIIASAAFLLLSKILARFPNLLWKARVQKTAALLSILPIVFYGLLAGMSPSTQRAVIMVIIFLMTFPLEKEHELINTIAIAALMILTCFPPALFSISFQLSFAAVLSIVYGISKVSKVSHEIRNLWKTLRQKLFLFFLVSFLATLGTMPIVLYYFNQVSLIGLFTNLLAIPAIGFMVLPLGFIAIILLPASPYLSSACIQVCDFILAPTIDVIRRLAELPFAAIKTITPSLFEICCFYALCWCVLNLIKPSTNQHYAPVYRKRIMLFAGFIALLLTADLFYWIHTRFFHNDLRVHMLDVGQGNAAVLELPDGYTILIDGGGFSNNQSFDVGERIVAPFLWSQKIGSVDTLVLSHPNSDHMNGLIYIARHFHVKNFWSTGDTAPTRSFQELRQTILENKIHHPPFPELPATQTINGVTIQTLYPEKSLAVSREKQKALNNNSLVLKVTYKNQSFLFPGDLMAAGENELVATYRDQLQSTVLMAPHHGSKTSSTKPFLKAVNPEQIVISCGWKNRFGAPHQTVLNRYTALGRRLYRTDESGCVSIATDGNCLSVIRPYPTPEK